MSKLKGPVLEDNERFALMKVSYMFLKNRRDPLIQLDRVWIVIKKKINSMYILTNQNISTFEASMNSRVATFDKSMIIFGQTI